ncbi:hypothetical protein [Collinsella intestinalis]|uniref:Uncharacterized protein n=1 Tax=Collinsella intestinalis TaxID=147207 RepID=A0A414NDX2_9ACTN|nr:hypothetical protein [Collinsella intestinalis]RHF37264.1 hypothetical protein DW682_06550 [Collinsella intestinalis]
MSKKSKRDMTPEELAELEAEDERAMEVARELRARREAVQGPAPIDREIHASLPLTRVFYPLLGCTIVAFMVSRFAANMGMPELETVTSTAATLLFLTSFIVWFVSRHQAKKLTREARGE